MSEKKFRRSTSNKIIAGVCGGIAEYFGIPAWVVRLVYAILTICTVGIFGIILYILLAVLVPKE